MVPALKFGAILLVVLQVFAGVDYINMDAKIRDEPDLSHQKGKNGPVPTCSNTTFCTDVPDYPTGYIDHLLSKDGNVKYLATVDEVVELNYRQDFDNDGESLCDSQETLVMPKTARDVKGNWLFVANTKKYVQTVRVESCVSAGETCKSLQGYGNGWQYLCKQTYAYRKLVAVTEEGKLAPQLMKLPSSCKCFMKFTGDPYARRQGTSSANNKNARPTPHFKTDWE